MHSKTGKIIADNIVDRCVFTVASKKKYLRFAYTLARSYRYTNGLDIPFYIVSDNDFNLPNDLKWVRKKIISAELMGNGVEFRFNFDIISPAHEALFIDSDSIIYKDISSLFDLPNTSLNVIGLKITEGSWDDMDPPAVLKEFRIPYLIRYCGAFYYIIKNDLSREICNKATELANSSYPFQKHTYSVNDEPVLSVSMASFGVEPILDNGNLWSDIHQLESADDLNVLKSRVHFNNSPEKTNSKFWLPHGDYSPMIVHFGGGNYNKNPWVFDAARLKLHYKLGLNSAMSDMLVNSFVKDPYFSLKKIRNAFR